MIGDYLEDLVPERRRPRAAPIPTEAEEKTIPTCVFVPFRCCRCGSTHSATYGRKGRRRFHRCQDCNARYRSLEMESVTPHEIAAEIRQLFS